MATVEAGTILAPILHLQEHDVFGERRWTGRAVLEGVICLDVLVFRFRDTLMAVRNRCPHRDMPLLLGRLDQDEAFLECPSHGWQIRLDGPELHARPVVEREGNFYLVISEG